MNYLTELSTFTGIDSWFLVAILIWSFIWMLLAMWKSAKKGHVAWFIIFALIHTLGILEILYIYVFSEIKTKKKIKVSKPARKPAKKKSSKKRR